jgi:tetratricopeptide (TPR) repeat protein
MSGMNCPSGRLPFLASAMTALMVLVLDPVPAVRAQESTRTRQLVLPPSGEAWKEVLPPAPGTAPGDLHAIRVLLREGAFPAALSATHRWEKTYTTAHPLHPDVLLSRAQALVALRRYDRAHRVLQGYLDRYGGVEGTAEALRLEFVVAEAYLGGAKRWFAGFIPLPADDVAFHILDEISVERDQDLLAPLAIKTKGDYLFRTGDHALAELEYARLVREYPNNRYHAYALRRSAESALANYRGIEYDDAPLIEAEERYREYRARYPFDADQQGVGLILETTRERRGAKDLETARYYDRTEHLSSAVYYYRRVVADWPDSVAATQARTRLHVLGFPVEASEEVGGKPAQPGEGIEGSGEVEGG